VSLLLRHCVDLRCYSKLHCLITFNSLFLEICPLTLVDLVENHLFLNSILSLGGEILIERHLRPSISSSRAPCDHFWRECQKFDDSFENGGGGQGEGEQQGVSSEGWLGGDLGAGLERSDSSMASTTITRRYNNKPSHVRFTRALFLAALLLTSSERHSPHPDLQRNPHNLRIPFITHPPLHLYPGVPPPPLHNLPAPHS